MDHLPLLILGIFISTLGIVNIKGNISTIHSYNRRKVTEEDVPKYGRAVGTGTLVIGVSLVLSYLITFWNEAAIGLYRSPGNDRWSGIYPVWADQIQSRHLLTGKSAPHEVSPREGRLIIPAPVCFRSFSRVPHTSSPADGVPVSLFSISPAAFPAPHASRYTASPSAIPQYRNPFLTARCTVAACSGTHSITTPFPSCLAKQISRSVSADA